MSAEEYWVSSEQWYNGSEENEGRAVLQSMNFSEVSRSGEECLCQSRTGYLHSELTYQWVTQVSHVHHKIIKQSNKTYPLAPSSCYTC